MRNPKIPEAAIKRLPIYLRVLEEVIASEVSIISSAELAERTGFSPEQIRKDLAYFGAFGTRGVGYDTGLLSRRIRKILGLHQGVKACLVGAGHLGHALVRYSASKPNDVSITAVFDNDEAKVGNELGPLSIRHASELTAQIAEQGIKIAILTVPAGAAQAVAEEAVAAGVEAILNFAPAKLRLGPEVFVQNIDLTIELQSLAYYTSAAEPEEVDDDADVTPVESGG